MVGKQRNTEPDMTTIYRAANSTDLFVGAHCAATEEEAISYTDNPGFGGTTVFTVEVENVLRCDDIDELADAMVAMGHDDSHTYDGWADEWRGRGLCEVFQAIENNGWIADALNNSEYEWVRFDEPSVGDENEMSTTYRYLGAK